MRIMKLSGLTRILALSASLAALAPTLSVGQSSAPLNAVVKPLPPRLLPPTLLLRPTDWVAITAGSYHTCALRQDRKVYCWGRDDLGQLGGPTRITCSSGSGAASTACINVPTFTGVMADQIDAGLSHTCSLLQGKATCWGLSQNGQVGAGFYGDTSAVGPASVAGNLSFTKISAGGNATCGINGTNVYCWGDIPSQPGVPTGNPVPQLYYTKSDPTAPYFNVSVGDGFACVDYLQRGPGSASGLWVNTACWGHNEYGQADSVQGLVVWAVPPSGIQIPSPSTVSVGGSFACFLNIILTCRGYNDDGELGNWNTGDRSLSQVLTQAGQPYSGITSAIALSTGLRHSCAIDAAGQAWCWGHALHGELGNAIGPGSSTIATQVVGGHKFRLIAAGGQHTCAVDASNIIYCWGDNSYGQLGTQVQGGYMPSPYPTNSPKG